VTLEDRVLYHQIHPAKLATDWLTAFGAVVLFWQHRVGAALLLGVIPSIVATIVIVNWVNLEAYRHSAFGRYMKRYMTRRVEAARFLGLVPLWRGAWIHQPLIIAAGVVWILGCWLWGLRRT
jgi:hypothetical protein